MKLFTAVACLTFLLIISAYGNRIVGAQDSGVNANTTPAATSTTLPAQANQSPATPTPQTSPQVAAERKIIRDADLTLEVADLGEGQSKLGAIVEEHGGFVVTSELRLPDNAATGDAQPTARVTAQLRVPVSQLDAALKQIRASGNRIRAEKHTGKDVTGEVTALSTINVTLELPATPAPTGFFAGIKSAFGYGLYIASAIIYVILRVVGVLLPLLLIFVLPPLILWRLILRFRRQ
jgi:hypothetical protein